MKVLQVCNLPTFIKQHLRSHINHLQSLGLEVESVCSDDKEVEFLRKEGYIIHTIPIDRQINLVSNVKCISKLVRLIRENQYDVVHVHNPMAALLGRIAARIAGVKWIIYTTHGFYFHQLTPPLQYALFYSVEILASYFTDLIFSVNQEDIDALVKYGLCPSAKTRYLGSVGVNLQRFNPPKISSKHQEELRQSFKIPSSAFPLVGTIGRLNEKKGSLYFIQAIYQLRQKYPHIHTLIIGEELSSDPGGCRNRVLELIKQLDLKDAITLTGYREDIPELISLMDIFTLPTFTHEGLPSAVIEAMAMEKPVVASDIRGCREAIVHQKTGLIVTPQNAAALAAAIDYLASHPEKARDMGKAGRERVKQKYDQVLVLKRLEQGYRDLGILGVSTGENKERIASQEFRR